MVFGKAVGHYGVSKRSKVTIVRVPVALENPKGNPLRCCVDGLAKILADFIAKGLQRKVVVLWAQGIPVDFAADKAARVLPDEHSPDWPLFNALRQLINAGVVVVNAAGNDGGPFLQSTIDHLSTPLSRGVDLTLYPVGAKHKT